LSSGYDLHQAMWLLHKVAFNTHRLPLRANTFSLYRRLEGGDIALVAPLVASAFSW
jgi:hypothetical protein